MSDPNERDGMSVTLKQDGKDGTWLVFHGSPARVKEQLADTFGLDAGNFNTLHELVLEATNIYKAVGNAANTLGARPIQSSQRRSSGGGGGNAWDRANGAAQAEQVNPDVVRLTSAIEAATSVDDLRQMWARDSAVFEAHAELKAAWNSKGKALSAAA